MTHKHLTQPAGLSGSSSSSRVQQLSRTLIRQRRLATLTQLHSLWQLSHCACAAILLVQESRP
jgi:hypothetical protein